MKDRLVSHLNSVFQALSIESEIEVYDCCNDILPEWARHLSHPYRYFVCTPAIDDLVLLKKFLCKDIFVSGRMLYWYDGDAIEPHCAPMQISSTGNFESPRLKTSTRLPSWLDDYIYGEWGAIYEPRPDEVVLNPEQPYDFVKLYLGTYFPRSYSEAYCIVNNLLDNNLYYEKLSGKEEIYLLDVCCGTGGEIIGAVYALCSRLPNLQRIYIESYDASVDAVRFLYHITSKLNEQVSARVFITPQQFYIDTERDYMDLMAMTNKTYDFILCFKAINEFVQQKIFELPYSYMAKGLLPKLSSYGVFILTDVTTPISDADRRFYPQLMNDQINLLLKEVGGFKTMVPYPCYNYEDRCSGCYMQDIFYVSHSKKYDDRSKIAYRVVGHSDFVRSVRVENQNYRCRVIDPNADKQAPYNRL